MRSAEGPSRWAEPSRLAPSLVVLLGTLLQIPFLGRGLGGDMYEFRMFQTSMVTREFMRSGFDWRTPLPVFGADSHVPFEFPAVQWLAAVAARVLDVTPEFATRLSGLVAFQLTAIAMWYLAQRWFSRTSALMALVLFQFLPFGVEWGHAALIDFWPVALILIAIALIDWAGSSDPGPRRTTALALAVVLIPTAFLVKSTTGFALIPLLLVPGLTTWSAGSRRDRLRPFVAAGLGIGLALALTAIWTRVSDDVKAQSKWTEPLTSGALREWNFGTIQQRLSSATWVRILDQHWAPITGGLVLLILIACVAVIGWRWSPPVLVVAVTPLLGPLVFVNLYIVHSYYSIAVYPVLTILMGAAGAVVVGRLREERDRLLAAAALVTAILSMVWLSPAGASYNDQLAASATESPISSDLRRLVLPGNGVLLLGCDWNPRVPYESDRYGLMLTDWQGVKPTPNDLSGITHAAFCGEPESGFDAALGDALPAGFSWTSVAPQVFALNRPS